MNRLLTAYAAVILVASGVGCCCNAVCYDPVLDGGYYGALGEIECDDDGCHRDRCCIGEVFRWLFCWDCCGYGDCHNGCATPACLPAGVPAPLTCGPACEPGCGPVMGGVVPGQVISPLGGPIAGGVPLVSPGMLGGGCPTGNCQPAPTFAPNGPMTFPQGGGLQGTYYGNTSPYMNFNPPQSVEVVPNTTNRQPVPAAPPAGAGSPMTPAGPMNSPVPMPMNPMPMNPMPMNNGPMNNGQGQPMGEPMPMDAGGAFLPPINVPQVTPASYTQQPHFQVVPPTNPYPLRQMPATQVQTAPRYFPVRNTGLPQAQPARF